MKIVIINGRGSSGKDKVVDYVTDLLSENILVWNISSIDPTKEAAKALGWRGTKTAKDRKFLADLKQLSVEYNNHPTRYLVKKIYYLIDVQEANGNDIVFVHIREPDEIEKIVKSFNDVYTLYIARHLKDFGNKSDDDCENYEYDHILDNTGRWKYTMSNINDWLKEIGIEDRYIEEGNRRISE